MNQIFNPENFFRKRFDKMADVVGLDLLWFLCSLPVVTALPAGMLCWLFPLCSRYRLTFRELNRTALRL